MSSLTLAQESSAECLTRFQQDNLPANEISREQMSDLCCPVFVERTIQPLGSCKEITCFCQFVGEQIKNI